MLLNQDKKMIIEHKNKGAYAGATTVDIYTYKVERTTREIRGKEYPASKIVESKESKAIAFDIDKVADLYSDYKQDKETSTELLARLKEEGITISIPIQKGKIHSDYITVSETKKK